MKQLSLKLMFPRSLAISFSRKDSDQISIHLPTHTVSSLRKYWPLENNTTDSKLLWEDVFSKIIT